MLTLSQTSYRKRSCQQTCLELFDTSSIQRCLIFQGGFWPFTSSHRIMIDGRNRLN